MRQFSVQPHSAWEIVGGTRRSQAAIMVLQPDESTGGPDNRHPDSDQWLYVVSGTGLAVVEGREVRLAAGSLMLIEAGEAHEVRGTGDIPFFTLNFYAPIAYEP